MTVIASTPMELRRQPLEEIATVVMGQSPPSATYNTNGEGLPFFQGKAEFGALYPAAVKWCTAPAKIAEPGDVLMSVRAPVGPTNLATERCCIGRGLAAIRPREEVRSKWLLYAFRSMEQDIDALGTGTTFKAISGEILRHLSVPVALPQHQDSVIAEIEKQFSRLDEASAALKRVTVRLSAYRNAVLAAALSRSLTSGTDIWNLCELNELAAHEPNAITDGPFGSKLKTEHYTQSGPRVVRLQNIGDGVFRDEKAYISHAHYESLAKHRVYSGDVVLAALGEILPRACLVPDWLGPAIVKADCIRFKPSQRILAKYLVIALIAPQTRHITKERLHGVGRPRLNLGEIKSIVVPVPSIDEQRHIIAEVERHLSVASELEAQVGISLVRADRLRDATLREAFTT